MNTWQLVWQVCDTYHAYEIMAANDLEDPSIGIALDEAIAALEQVLGVEGNEPDKLDQIYKTWVADNNLQSLPAPEEILLADAFEMPREQREWLEAWLALRDLIQRS